MKIRKRIIAAMTIATVLSSSVSISHATSDFKIDTGNAGTGQQATQSAQTTASTTGNTTPKSVSGDIEINGIFNKTITNLPTPDKDGRYLRVTMPIKMDYIYDVDTNKMTVANNALIQNNSVLATSTGTTNATLTPQPVKMTLEDIKLTSNSTANAQIKFVNRVDPAEKNYVQLPFKITVDGPSTNVKDVNLKTIESSGTKEEFTIQGSSNLSLTLGLITGQVIGNPDLIDKAQTQVSHDLTLKFEYIGK